MATRHARIRQVCMLVAFRIHTSVLSTCWLNPPLMREAGVAIEYSTVGFAHTLALHQTNTMP